METRYLNTDLDLESRDDLQAIINDFGEKAFVLHHGPANEVNHVSFELSNDIDFGPDETLRTFCDLVEKLSVPAKEVWSECLTRTLDIGIEAGPSPACYQIKLHPATCSRVSAIGATLVLSIYPSSTE